MDPISDDELQLVKEMVSEQRAIPAIIVDSIIARLDKAERPPEKHLPSGLAKLVAS